MGTPRGERELSYEEKVGTGYWRGQQEKGPGHRQPHVQGPWVRGNMGGRDCRRPVDTQGKSSGQGRCQGLRAMLGRGHHPEAMGRGLSWGWGVISERYL